ncbi:hypothetical protein BJ944DRAFT_54130, partial [Cunninghamella echinulata]
GYPRPYPPYGYPWGGDEDNDYYGDDREDYYDDRNDRFEGRNDRFEKRGHHDDDFDADDYYGDDHDDDDHNRYYRGGYRHSPWGGYPWGGYRRGRGRYHHDDKRDQVTEQQEDKVVTESETTTDAPTIQKRDHVNVYTSQNYNVNSGNRGGVHGESYYGAEYEGHPYWTFMDEVNKRDHVDIYTNQNFNKDSFNRADDYPDVWAFGAGGEFDKREESATNEESKLSKRDHLRVYNNVNYNEGSFNSETNDRYDYGYPPYYRHPIYYGQDFMDESL